MLDSILLAGLVIVPLYSIALLVYVARIHHELKTMRKDFPVIFLGSNSPAARVPPASLAPTESSADPQWYQDENGQWYQS